MPALEIEKWRGRNAALAIAAVVILLGLPLWWKTTETYRAWLPYSQISELDSLQLQLSVEVEVVFSRGTLSPEIQKNVPFSQTREQDHQVDAKNRLRYRYETKYRTATVMEEDALNQPTPQEADLTLHTLSASACGSVMVYVLPESSSLLPTGVKVYVGQWRTALLRGAPLHSSGSLKEALSALEPQVKQVIDTMSFSHQEVLGALSDRIRISQVSKESLVDSMRAIKSSPGYEITFSLLNPDPKSHSLHWDIEGAVHSYIQPLLNKLNPIANFSVDSQILYYAALGVNPRFDSSLLAYVLNAASLAHVINPVEARLGSNAASSYPVLNFLLYVPEAHHSPLFIRDHQTKTVPSNAFHSPRWGGIMVYNVNDTYGPNININMAEVMSVFLAQLRLLLGVQRAQPPPGFVLQSPGAAGLADWELDRLMWSRTVENVATATTTITSLAQLLDQISNIVINDNIAEQFYIVNSDITKSYSPMKPLSYCLGHLEKGLSGEEKVSSAVASLQAAVAKLEAGNLASALQYSREAILASERAFFDPSLLHLLYFPDDQKFAIYIPLFLPMCVPIVLSLLKIANDIRQKRADKQAKKD